MNAPRGLVEPVRCMWCGQSMSGSFTSCGAASCVAAAATWTAIERGLSPEEPPAPVPARSRSPRWVAAVRALRPRGWVAPVAGLLLVADVTAGVAYVVHVESAGSVPVSRVVESRCFDGTVQQGLDTGRADGQLLAQDTGVSC